MKKKILGLCMVACLGVTVAGCDATMDDVEEQAEKMEAIIEEGDIFEDDWSINVIMSDDESNYTVKKDGDNYYIKMVEEDEVSEGWLIKENGDYTAYLSSDDEKYYTELSEDEIDNMIDYSLDYVYLMAKLILESAPEICEIEGTTCEFEKTLFGKLNIGITEDDVTTTISVRGGKVLSITVEEDGEVSTSIKIKYGNQRVKAPSDKDDYELKD